MATDVAKILGYRDGANMVRNLRERNKGTHSVSTLGGSQTLNIINEPGLYQAVMKSKLPEAERFQDWVTDEVLPSIRKHGGYLTETKLEEALLNPDTLIQLATNLKEEQQARKALELEKAENEPKVRLAEAVGESSRNVTLTAMSKILRNVGIQMNRNEFCQWLRI